MEKVKRFLQSKEMGRRSLVLAGIVSICILSYGCVTVQPVKQGPAQEVVVKVVSADGKKVEVDKEVNKITKTMQIPYDEPVLPGESTQIGDTVFYPIWSYIGTADPLNLKKTLEVMKYKKLKKMHIYINSGGGSAFAGLACADIILAARASGLTIMTEANGLVASAAVPIFVVGRPRVATPGTALMIHEGKLFKLFAEETKSDLNAQKKMMDMTDNRYNKILVDNSNLSLKEIENMISKTSWFTAEEAKSMGFVDDIK